MRETVLITGADSPLARAVIAALPAGTALRAVDAGFDEPFAPHVDARRGDLRDAELVAGLLEGVDSILHLAPIATRLGDDRASLDHATRGSYVLANAAQAAGVRRIVLGSTLGLFEQYPANYRVSEAWRPRPRPAPDDLCAYLPERTLRELARGSGIATLCLRFGTIVSDAQAAALPYDRRWLHLDDAVGAVLLALAWDKPGWTIAHITAGARSRVRLSRRTQAALKYDPQHDFSARWPSEVVDAGTPPATIAQRPVRNVVIFGAGGPLGAAAADELAADYTLRLADLRSPEELAALPPQSPGAPQLQPLAAPHETIVVDVTDARAVLDACRGMDAIINCTVIRSDPVEAFRVNLLGAANVMDAALAHAIARVVHTGPYLIGGLQGASGYAWDDWVVDDAPPRPGSGHDIQLYLHSKYLAQELCRIYAEYHGLAVPTLLFCNFVSPEHGRDDELYPFSVSWRDAARALRLALTAALPAPFEVLHINADLPHGVFPNAKARRVLGWQPRDDLRGLWSDEPSGTG